MECERELRGEAEKGLAAGSALCGSLTTQAPSWNPWSARTDSPDLLALASARVRMQRDERKETLLLVLNIS